MTRAGATRAASAMLARVNAVVPTVERAQLAAAREAVRTALDAGAGGVAVCAGFSDALDTLVATVAGTVPAGMALVATGGWGRRDTGPHSDLDLLFLTRGTPDDEVRAFTDRVLYPLWDAGLELGHAVRPFDEALALAAHDLPTATALLHARALAGDATLVDALAAALPRELHRAGENAFVDRLRGEMHARHSRFGDSIYLLEPNLKLGHGALRDLSLGLWAARARWGTRDLAGLLAHGHASPRQVALLAAALDFFLALRARLHLETRRRQDQLTFELQEALAPRLHPRARTADGDVRPAVAPAVEALMQEVYRHARLVVRETERLLDRATLAPRRAPHVVRLDRELCVWNGQLSFNDGDLVRERPAEAVRLLCVAVEQDLPVYGHTQELVAELVAERGAELVGDAAAARQLLVLLCDPRDAAKPSRLELAHQLGLLTAVIPELSPCTGRVQHDLYHVYTVDQHQLYAVALMKRLVRGELADEAPGPTAAARALVHPAPVYLATLLHDAGKPLGKSHADKGAELVARIAPRLGLDEHEARRAELLVRQHLLMSHLSQRRDLSDPATIESLVRTVSDEETLRGLYVLTFCDTSMTAPGNMTAWKATLLDELYERARAHLRHGPGRDDEGRAALVRRRRREVAARRAGAPDADALASWLGGLPDRYTVAFGPSTILGHFALARARAGRAAAMAVRHHPKKGFSEVAIVADDAPGVLARVAGVMLAHRVDVVSAQVASRATTAPGDTGEVVDVFYVRDAQGRAIPAADPRWRRIEDDLCRVLASADADADDAAAPSQGVRRERSGLPPRVTPLVLTEIEIDNEVAREFTVIDVYTQDRPGVLHAIALSLSRLGLDIGLSKVATEAARVADVFYVRDRVAGSKVTDAARLAEIEAALREALAALPLPGGRS